MIKYSYDEIYGVSLEEYLQEQNTTIDAIILKIQKDIELLKKRLSYLVEQDNIHASAETSYLINVVYDTIRKKDKHLSRIEEWCRNERY